MVEDQEALHLDPPPDQHPDVERTRPGLGRVAGSRSCRIRGHTRPDIGVGQRRYKMVPANVIEIDVDALRRRRLHGLDQLEGVLGLAIVDGLVEPCRLQPVALLLAAGRADPGSP